MIFKRKKALQKVELKDLKIPNHIAFIMDGNGRWAQSKGLPRNAGHQEGGRALGRVIEASQQLGVKYVTFYAFSTENWKRPIEEVNHIMGMPIKFFNEFKAKHKEDEFDYRFRFIGKRDRISKENLELFEKVEKDTMDNKGLTVIIALDYGSREEIVNACKRLMDKNIDSNTLTEDLFQQELYTHDIPDVDLLVRTSGEQRISNFLLWQISYAELYFEQRHWPSMNKKVLEEIIYNYQTRDRRFGGLK